VLAHEIAHLAGSDPLRHVAARLAVTLYWFHPLAWIAARESAVSREQACDEGVLSLGLKPSTYARVLLELAESAQRPRPLLGALPMVEPSLLEKRLMAILNGELQPAARRLGVGVAIAGALLTLSIAAARPAALSSGQIASTDPTLVASPITDASAELPGVASVKPIDERLTPTDPVAGDQRGLDREARFRRSRDT
jgi:beta-lactamase regulating signal transducer with metallopeptidase domain